MHAVEFLPGFLPDTFDFLPAQGQTAVLVDEHTLRDCYPLVKAWLPPHRCILIPSGEQHKTIDTCQVIWQALTDMDMERGGWLLNLGGGVIGDMGGFCAATYKRGIRFCQVPTTLLAQVDASVGGKLGIDFQGFKNHIGVFAAPERVLIHTGFLATLPPRELRSGFAEVVKHCLIADADRWQYLRQTPFAALDWGALVPHSVSIKSAIVAQDPREKGPRKLLNFGHTFGHALESHLLEDPARRLLHGEAVGIGMAVATLLSEQLTGLPATERADIIAFLAAHFPPVTIDQADLHAISLRIQQDKKNHGGSLRFVLLHHIGSACFDQQVRWQDVCHALERLPQLVRLG